MYVGMQGRALHGCLEEFPLPTYIYLGIHSILNLYYSFRVLGYGRVSFYALVYNLIYSISMLVSDLFTTFSFFSARVAGWVASRQAMLFGHENSPTK